MEYIGPDGHFLSNSRAISLELLWIGRKYLLRCKPTEWYIFEILFVTNIMEISPRCWPGNSRAITLHEQRWLHQYLEGCKPEYNYLPNMFKFYLSIFNSLIWTEMLQQFKGNNWSSFKGNNWSSCGIGATFGWIQASMVIHIRINYKSIALRTQVELQLFQSSSCFLESTTLQKRRCAKPGCIGWVNNSCIE